MARREYDSRALVPSARSFPVQVTGIIAGSADITIALVTAIVEVVTAVTSGTVKRVIVSLKQTVADIEVEFSAIDQQTKIRKAKLSGQIYSQAINEVQRDEIYPPEIKEEMIDNFIKAAKRAIRDALSD